MPSRGPHDALLPGANRHLVVGLDDDSVTRQHGGRSTRAHDRLDRRRGPPPDRARSPGRCRRRARGRSRSRRTPRRPRIPGSRSPLASAASSSSWVNTSGDSIALADMEQPYLGGLHDLPRCRFVPRRVDRVPPAGRRGALLPLRQRQRRRPSRRAGAVRRRRHRGGARLADAVHRPPREPAAHCSARSTIASAPTARTRAGSRSSTSTSSCSHPPARRSRSCCASTRSTRASA